jgi:hypothetical protein
MVTRTHGVVIACGNHPLGLDSDLSLKIISLQNGQVMSQNAVPEFIE